MKIPEGYYPGKITGALVDKKDERLCFDCEIELPDGSTAKVTAKHPTKGQHKKIGREVIEHLGLAWPSALLKIEDLAPGIETEIRIKHNAGDSGAVFVNAYIATNPPLEPATPEQLNALVAKLEAEALDDEIGF